MRIIHQKKKMKLYMGIIIGIIILLFFMMPYFYVYTIEVNNNHFYSAEEIVQVSNLEKRHFFDIAYNEARDKLLKLDYIADVKIQYVFPGRIRIDLVEKTPYAYVKFAGIYLCLNEKGQVIEQSAKKEHELPIIDGLKFDNFITAETLPIENQDQWLCAIDIIHYLEKHDYVSNVRRIDVYNLEEIHLYVDKLDVIMGDIGDFDKKIEALIEIHKEYNMGVLDISTYAKTKEAYLKPLT